ncbi:flagellar motor protein MotS [Geomicrobium sp. JCM 19039]|uniref:flagellar motor protein MotS n=1 Tax=Geomicrobium sp. JCM 19039 TaxID=1460636 RepID=UPI00045F323C|nr:flagellar motor protein MotS [Geomicrobium sp. JCM 19039]GAK12965.1 flagellar motor rotation protein MotB [Geomicrobium sp. JCM 19039]
MRRRSKSTTDQSKSWLVTFTDMVLIILVFFIMLFSISVVDAQRFQALTDSLQGNNILDDLSSVTDYELENFDPADDQDVDEDTDPLTEVKEYIDQYLIDHDLEDMITATREEQGIVLVLQEQLLFNTGEAYILEDAEPFLDEMTMILEGIPDHQIEVEGHTDNRPIETYRYPSNWELSAARASSVIRYLIDGGDSLQEDRFLAKGYADTRPMVPNDSRENMQENRRVVVMISDPEFDEEGTENT